MRLHQVADDSTGRFRAFDAEFGNRCTDENNGLVFRERLGKPAGEVLHLVAELLGHRYPPLPETGVLIPSLAHLLDVRGDHLLIECIVDFAGETCLLYTSPSPRDGL